MLKSVLLIAFCIASANAEQTEEVFTKGGRAVKPIQMKKLELPSTAVISNIKSSAELVNICSGTKIQEYVNLILSDTVEVVKYMGWEIGEILFGTFVVCLDPFLVGWCVEYDYPAAMLLVLADIPISLGAYADDVMVLLAHILMCLM